MQEHELDHVLLGTIDADKFSVNAQEVQAYAWVDVEVLRKDLEANPRKYTAWLAQAVELVLAHKH